MHAVDADEQDVLDPFGLSGDGCDSAGERAKYNGTLEQIHWFDLNNGKCWWGTFPARESWRRRLGLLSLPVFMRGLLQTGVSSIGAEYEGKCVCWLTGNEKSAANACSEMCPVRLHGPRGPRVVGLQNPQDVLGRMGF
jgi:hypothetical protein